MEKQKAKHFYRKLMGNTKVRRGQGGDRTGTLF